MQLKYFLSGVFGFVFLLSMIVPFAVLIGGTTIWFIVHKKIDKVLGISKFVGLIYRLCDIVGKYIFLDVRNSSLLLPIVFCTLWPLLLYSFAYYRVTNYGFELWFCFVIHIIRLGPRYRFFAYQHVLIHKDGHAPKRLFKGVFKIFNGIVQYVTGPLYGVVTNSYPIAHNKLHHIYNNMLDDPHTNLDLDRTKFWSFIVYMPRFLSYWIGLGPAIFLFRKKEWIFLYYLLKGMIWYFSVIGVFLWLNWKFAIAYIVYPCLEDIVFLGGISYMWHCFVDPENIYNQYSLSVTILEGHDNIMNEDFHVVHHADTIIHWTDYRKHYEQHVNEYRDNQATIFRDIEQGILLFLILAGKWDKLAEHFVDLKGKMTHEDKKKLILTRLSKTIRS